MKYTYILLSILWIVSLSSCSTAEVAKPPAKEAPIAPLVVTEQAEIIAEETSTPEITPNLAVCYPLIGKLLYIW